MKTCIIDVKPDDAGSVPAQTPPHAASMICLKRILFSNKNAVELFGPMPAKVSSNITSYCYRSGHTWHNSFQLPLLHIMSDSQRAGEGGSLSSCCKRFKEPCMVILERGKLNSQHRLLTTH